MSANNSFNGLFKLTPDYVKEACKVAGNAFEDDPLMVFIYPDEKERKQKSQYGFYSMYKYGIKHGLTYATSTNFL